MNFETIIVEKKDGVARITFNRPQVLNAFNPQMSDELKAAVKDIAADKEVRVVVFTAQATARSWPARISIRRYCTGWK